MQFKMCPIKILNFTVFILIVLSSKSGNATKTTDNSIESSEGSSFVIHLANTELLKNENLSEIVLKVDSKLANFTLELQRIIVSMLNQHSDEVKKETDRRLEQQMKSVNDAMQKIQKLLEKEPQTMKNQNSSLKEKLPQSCAEALSYSTNKKSGIYELHLPGYDSMPFSVYCKYSASWTIIQRRQDNSTDFYRNWNEYVGGFGDLKSNFFIGLNKLHAMTNAQPHELWIQLEDFEGEHRHARYDKFEIGNANERYALKTLGKFSGDAGDSFSYHTGMNFSTKDTGSCAVLRKGAWWYKSCHESNLNGLYLHGKGSSYATGIVWEHWHGQAYSLKSVFMAIRPKSNA